MSSEQENKVPANQKINITIDNKTDNSEDNVEELSEDQLREIIARQRRRSSFVVEEIVNYCVTLVKVEFAGQSSTIKVSIALWILS